MSVAEEMNAKRRCTMEDCVIVSKLHKYWTMLGVFDGHGGRDIVDFLERNFAGILRRELLLEDDDATVPQRLERSFLLADILSYQQGIHASGATAIVCLLHQEPHSSNASSSNANSTTILYTANCGDARAVLYSAATASTQRLSQDHKADDPVEQDRICQTGGFVFQRRTLGILAVSRSIGDHPLKDYVIGTPSIQITHVATTADDSPTFLILACDGIWDVLTDDQATQLVQSYYWETIQQLQPATTSNNKQLKQILQEGAAHRLIQQAIKLNSGDNISAIVVFFFES